MDHSEHSFLPLLLSHNIFQLSGLHIVANQTKGMANMDTNVPA